MTDGPTAPPTSPTPTPPPATSSGCATSAPGPTAPHQRQSRALFIQTLLNEWAYGPVFANSAERTTALKPWLTYYNFTRPHGSLGHKPPGTRLTNLFRNYS